MILNYVLTVGTIQIPVPADNRPPVTSETTSVVMDFGTFDLPIPNAPAGCPSTTQIFLGEMPIPISNETYPTIINVALNTVTVRYDDGVLLPDEPDLNFITPSEFISRLTDAEVVAFEGSANATVIRHWLDLTTYDTDLNDLDTLDKFELFIALNLITEQRSAEILA